MESINIGMARRKYELIVIYLLLGVYGLAISWYYNHSVLCAVIDYLAWPLYLGMEFTTGKLSHGMWKIICESYFI
jgi:hypothetical protein